ncbi:HNH endonuclease family protein [Microbacterium terregens]|uniref:HNH endonuclease family protein n=1 Tax=Microbacterium terregens TaxID=69363 RepID=A0ABV5T0X0_9MICO
MSAPYDRQRGLPWLIWVLAAIVALAAVLVIAVPLWAVLSDAGHDDDKSPGSTAAPTTPSPATTSPTASPAPGPGDTPSPRPSTTASRTPTPSPPSLSPGVREALAALADLDSVSGSSTAGYDRGAFGQAWYDEDRNGCDTRNDMLRRDLTQTVVKPGTNNCKVLTGTLVDPYTGETLEFVSGTTTSVLVQIDHLVPLSWAWRHGAEFWTTEERTSFANDPANLRATSGPVNQSKSDSGPGTWMPPAETAHCNYAKDFIVVLASWNLGIGTADRDALQRTLAVC